MSLSNTPVFTTKLDSRAVTYKYRSEIVPGSFQTEDNLKHQFPSSSVNKLMFSSKIVIPSESTLKLPILKHLSATICSFKSVLVARKSGWYPKATLIKSPSLITSVS